MSVSRVISQGYKSHLTVIWGEHHLKKRGWVAAFRAEASRLGFAPEPGSVRRPDGCFVRMLVSGAVIR